MRHLPLLSISHIPTERTHQGTTHVKRLVRTNEQHRGNIATMNYAWLDPDKQLEAHIHPDGEEFYYFLEGNGTMLVGSEWFDVCKGDFVTVPIRHVHSVKNSSRHPLVFITIRTVQSKSS